LNKQSVVFETVLCRS